MSAGEGLRVRLVRGLVSGLAGTTVMTVTTKAESVLRGAGEQPVDYDDSYIPVHLIERVGHLDLEAPVEGWVNELARVTYGSVAGLVRTALDGRVRRPAVAFFVATWGAEVVALPALGLAPPVWRWRRDVLATSMVQHALYAWVTDAVYRTLAPAPEAAPGTPLSVPAAPKGSFSVVTPE